MTNINYFWMITIVILFVGAMMGMAWQTAFTEFKTHGIKTIKGYISIIYMIVIMFIGSLSCYIIMDDFSNYKLRDAYYLGFKLEIDTKCDVIDGEMLIHKADTTFNVNYKDNYDTNRKIRK